MNNLIEEKDDKKYTTISLPTPLAEKIKRVVSNYPLLSIFQIRKMLRHEKFGNARVGVLKLYRTLRNINLESRAKRFRFYRSC